MKKIIFGLLLVLLVAGCAGLPDFGGLLGGNKVNTTELSPDLIVVQNINVIPNPPINAGDQFSVSFETKNQDNINQVNSAYVDLYDYGLCVPKDIDTTFWTESGGTYSHYFSGGLAPLQTEFTQINFDAPSNSAIGYLSAKCPIRFEVNYTYTSGSKIDVDVISQDRLNQLQKAGTPPSFTPSLSVGRGPVKIYFSFGSELPIKSGNTLSLFVTVQDKGTGLYGEIPANELFISFPKDFTGVECGTKFDCSNALADYCKGSYGIKIGNPGYDPLCDVNNNGVYDLSDLVSFSSTNSQGCVNIVGIPVIKKVSPQMRCTAKVPSVDIEKTYYISGSLGYSYNVDGETTVGIKPTMT